MEKAGTIGGGGGGGGATKSKYKQLLTILPKAAFNFQNPPFSPGRDKRAAASSELLLKTHHHHHHHHLNNKAFSGPIISIIPPEARGVKSSSSKAVAAPSSSSEFDNSQEPTSPKVSCMGQIKHRKRLGDKKKKQIISNKEYDDVIDEASEAGSKNKPSTNKRPFSLSRIFSSNARPRTGRKHDASATNSNQQKSSNKAASSSFVAPSLGQMKRFASGRESLANFDWTRSQIAPEEEEDDGDNKYSDGEEEEVIIPFSAPIPMGGGGPGRVAASAAAGLMPLEPRKDINLWKRRTMVQPRPLNLDLFH